MTSLQTIAKLTALDRQVTLTCTVEGSWDTGGKDAVHPAGLGCHFRWMCGLGFYPKWDDVKTLSTGEKVKFALDTWGVAKSGDVEVIKKALQEWRISEEEKDRLFGVIANSFGKIRTTRENSYGPTSAGTPSGPTFVVMSDNINSYTPEFPKNSGIHTADKIANGLKTSDFVQWLIKKNFGIVVGSPVGRNHWHQNSENFSLVQAWFWIPPHHAGFVAPDSHFISGLNHQPDWDKWYEDVRKTDGMSKRTDADMDTRMWKNGHRNSHLDLVQKEYEEKVA